MWSWPLEWASVGPGLGGWVDRFQGRRGIQDSERIMLIGDLGDFMENLICSE